MPLAVACAIPEAVNDMATKALWAQGIVARNAPTILEPNVPGILALVVCWTMMLGVLLWLRTPRSVTWRVAESAATNGGGGGGSWLGWCARALRGLVHDAILVSLFAYCVALPVAAAAERGKPLLPWCLALLGCDAKDPPIGML